jgi:hypothetical protein
MLSLNEVLAEFEWPCANDVDIKKARQN